MSVKLGKILELLKPDEKVIAKGKERQNAIWQNKKSDYIPILVGGKVQERDKYPCYNLKEQFFDKEKMLAEQLWRVIAQARGRSDAQLCLRANFGTGFVATIFGLNQTIFEDKMPWLKRHLSREQILNFKFPEDITKIGLIARAIEYINFFKESLGDKAHVYLCDTQGPFSIAHLVRGDDIFTDIYDTPDFVHHLLQLSTQAYIKTTRVMKAIIGEELDSGYHSVNLYMGRGGVRICEDTATLLSPVSIKEFVIPYLKEALQPFGGGWVHFCGKNYHLLDLIIDVEEVRGINLGNPEMYDYEEVMTKLLVRAKFYYGGWPKKESENLREYFERILKPVKNIRKGLIFTPTGGNGEDWQDPTLVIDLWRSF